MTELDRNDLTIEHMRLKDGRGYFRIVHNPSGKYVEAYATSEPVTRIKERLMRELAEKVHGTRKGDAGQLD
jgi:hypothetical protein